MVFRGHYAELPNYRTSPGRRQGKAEPWPALLSGLWGTLQGIACGAWTSHAWNRYVFPTAAGTTASPNAFDSALTARQPVQCAAAMVVRLMTRAPCCSSCSQVGTSSIGCIEPSRAFIARDRYMPG